MFWFAILLEEAIVFLGLSTDQVLLEREGDPMGKRGWILAVVLVIATIGGFWYWQVKVKGTPSYSLHQAAHAVENHDLQQFKKYVDVEGVSERLVDDIVDQASNQMSASSPAEQLGQSLGQGLAELMKPRLVEEIQGGVERYVETGEVAGEFGERASVDPDSLARVFQGIDSTNITGSMARVYLRVRDVRADSTATLELRMREMDGYWQVAEIANIQELISASESDSEVNTRIRALKASMKSDLRNLATAQEGYFAQYEEYASSVSALEDFYSSSGVDITLREATSDGWSATADHDDVPGQDDCGVAFGSVGFPAEAISGEVEESMAGAPSCQ